ncbi:LysR substrate-binding domain-containing protein [Streptomyces sp. NPDC102395]|uniref:LysR substrate-binding domain-containing protein n=1 Tax=Streptomyces sp. NPDC102395 TaxID=3366168 RepID=UPI0038011575
MPLEEIPLPRPFDDHGLDSEPLPCEPRVVALAAADPLAERPRLHLADLHGRVLPDGSPADQDGRAPRPTGRGAVADRPRRLDMSQMFSLIEVGSIIWFPPVSVARRHPRPGIVYPTVADLRPLEFALAWPQRSRSPAVAAFIRTAAVVAAAAPAP